MLNYALKGGRNLRDYILERATREAFFIMNKENGRRTYPTLRETARRFGVSKTTTHKDLVERLPKIDPILATKVSSILKYNKRMRSKRGGEAIKKKHLTAE